MTLKPTVPLLLGALAFCSSAGATQPVLGDPAAWRADQPPQPTAVIVRNATIWTGGPAGRLEGADLLVRSGKISAVGADLAAPPGAQEVDATGKHVTAGLIDAHSHAAISGGVNEGTNITTSEVRIGDVINAESINIYWQLTGGLTAANLMHGSANSINGQTAVIKLRWGAPPEELLFAKARPGIKFALGENPKQSNWNVDERRYPQTRPGVEQSIRERFRAAVDYKRKWDEYRATDTSSSRRSARKGDRSKVPPRRDLQLEAIVEILEGKRDIHAHSYRADEIIMLMRIAEDFGFRVNCFQHVLEGYKVANELAEHGAGASTFSDWWAYKFEVIDAIPYNGAIMWDRGVVVSFNSDDSELARRMNLEAAKAVRYGGVPEEEALKFVTLNPAIQLGIDEHVGSLEVGKDADFVVWSGHPFSTYTVAEQTWIDGRKYFDRSIDLELREAVIAERDALIEKVRALEADPEDGEKGDEEQENEGESSEEPTPTTSRANRGHAAAEDQP